jgi:hypothetical protein
MYNPYPSGVTIPVNICPLTISYPQIATTKIIVFDSTNKPCDSAKYIFNKTFAPKQNLWQKYLTKAFKGRVEITHSTAKHIWYVAEPIDKYIFYRKTLFNEDIKNMFVEQRDLETFSAEMILESAKNPKSREGHTCINCHGARNNNINHRLFHVRLSQKNAGTYLVREKEIIRINKDILPERYSRLVYYDFHPTKENIIVFSTNSTGTIINYIKQGHKEDDYSTDTNGIIILYDVAKQKFIIDKNLTDSNYEYSFPNWNNSGTELYFARGPKRNMTSPQEFLFDLYKVNYDTLTGATGTPTLIFPFSECGVSVTMPKPIPNTNKIIVTVHKSSGSIPLLTDGDYYILDLDKTQNSAFQMGINPESKKTCTLPKGKYAKITEAKSINTIDNEKYHSFSSNGKWMVFSSGRIAGEQSIPHIVYHNKNGEFGKPFALPQKDPKFYTRNTYSYVYPQTSTTKAKLSNLQAAQLIK